MTPIADDLVQPFQIESSVLRGRLVRLGPLIDTILTRHDYPEAVALILGEAIALAVLLAGALKYEGIFTLQTKGNGPIGLVVADVTSAGAVRGYAQFDAEMLAQRLAKGGEGAMLSVPRLLGAGYLAFTVDQGEHTERYQGIVELDGTSLAECAHHYFRQSEQIRAGIKLAIGRDAEGKWRAGGMMLQRLPGDESEEDDEGWRRAIVFLGSATSAELLDRAIAPNDLLFRLFHDDGVRSYPPHALAAKCRCSRERLEGVLGGMPAEDLIDMAQDGVLHLTCEFCNATYDFGLAAIMALQSG